MANTQRLALLRDAWSLAKPYWVSDDKWRAWGLLVAVVGLNLVSVFINVRLNIWRNAFYNTLQQLDERGFFVQLGVFTGLAVAWIGVVVYQLYLQQMLQIRWRRWLTHRYLGDWLDRKAYYRLQLQGSETDNPDQRISEDLNRFTAASLTLSLGLLNAAVTLASFLGILWVLSGSLTVPLGHFGAIAIPGYMFWFALVYAAAGTWLTIKVGRPLVGLNFAQQRFEADFRFSLVRLRENAESVALYGGEGRELASFRELFTHVVDNFWSIMKRTKTLGWWTSFYGQFAVIFPYIVAAPRFFAKQMELGGLMQTADAFGTVQSSLSFIVTAYADIAAWESVVQRLVSFDRRVRDLAASAQGPQPIAVAHDGQGLEVAGLALDLPGGSGLLRHVTFAAKPSDAVLVTGPTGSGKSTLLRAISGVWPYGRGEIRMPRDKVLFVPQRPYFPLGTLREAVAYPKDPATIPDERLREVLRLVGLEGFADRLDEPDNWAQRLSLGEQQRVSFARVFLIEPTLVFLDEATSALDEPSEAYFYGLLRSAPWRPTIVSVGHRGTLGAFHDRTFDVRAFQPAGSPAHRISPAASDPATYAEQTIR
jgi:putative ATP-binding cassette transporter